MTNEQLRIALVANAVTRSNRIGFDFQDPAGKTLDEYTKEAMMQCVRVAQKGQTLTEATRSTKQYIEKAANQRSTTDVAVPATMEEIPPVYNEGTPYVRLAMLCAYYLASKGSDVHLNPIKKEDRQPFMFKGKAQRVNVKVFTVGDHVAEKYKNEGDGKAPRWRHYWGGNGRERRECKFSF